MSSAISLAVSASSQGRMSHTVLSDPECPQPQLSRYLKIKEKWTTKEKGGWRFALVGKSSHLICHQVFRGEAAGQGQQFQLPVARPAGMQA